MRIGELAARAHVSVRSLRYYDEQGLLRARRSSSGQRRYDEEAIARVEQIQSLYVAGMNSAMIGEMLPCFDTPAHGVPRQLRERLCEERARIDQQLTQLEQVRGAIDGMLTGTNGDKN